MRTLARGPYKRELTVPSTSFVLVSGTYSRSLPKNAASNMQIANNSAVVGERSTYFFQTAVCVDERI